MQARSRDVWLVAPPPSFNQFASSKIMIFAFKHHCFFKRKVELVLMSSFIVCETGLQYFKSYDCLLTGRHPFKIRGGGRLFRN